MLILNYEWYLSLTEWYLSLFEEKYLFYNERKKIYFEVMKRCNEMWRVIIFSAKSLINQINRSLDPIFRILICSKIILKKIKKINFNWTRCQHFGRIFKPVLLIWIGLFGNGIYPDYLNFFEHQINPFK